VTVYEIKRTTKQIDDLISKCWDQENEGGSKYPGMTFEQGIKEAIDWITGNQDETPLEDD
jgi:hypothetical protein